MSIRVEFDGAGVPVTDVVTYCGITTFGNPSANGPLTTTGEFAAPPAAVGYTPAGGATDNGPGQWDGLIGRVSSPHTGGTAPTTPIFQAIVGGREQDGLFGLAEISVDPDKLVDRFVVVGSTRIVGLAAAGASTFPLTLAMSLNTAATYCLGTVSVFQATAGGLVMQDSKALGALDSRLTMARDVHVAQGAVLSGARMFYVVGSTTDELLFPNSSVALVGPDATFAGPTDGFLVGMLDDPTAVFPFLVGTYQGDEGDDGATGVGGWNEYPDHVSVVGFRQAPLGTNEITVANYCLDLVVGSLVALPSGTIDGDADDRPTAMGVANATAPATGLGFVTSNVPAMTVNLRDPAGGGIAVDQRARVNIVGTTNSTNYPVSSVLVAPFLVGRSKIGGGVNYDAVRAVFDMVPAGIARTDMSGDVTRLFDAVTPSNAWNVTPPTPALGSTTPFCAMGPFGAQIGMPAPLLPRMLIDWEGFAPSSGVSGVILVDRSPPGSSVSGAFIAIGFPSTTPIVDPLIPGVEMWVSSSTSTFVLVFTSTLTQMVRYPIGPLPPTGIFSVQAVSLLGSTVVCPTTSTSHGFAATPALFFRY